MTKITLTGFYMVLALLLGGAPIRVLAQEKEALAEEPRPWQSYLDALAETEDYENVRWEDYEEMLGELAEHPININTATREELEQLPFLSSQQVEDILAYIYRYGGVKSLAELQVVGSVDWRQRQLLGCFVYAGESKRRSFPTWANVLKYGKQELVGSVKIPLYERAGDKNGYMGYPYKHWLRYQMRLADYVKLGLVASQDAGEPFFGGKNKAGYDFYSFYLQVKNWGRLKNLTIGRYRLREGMGLILNNDLSMGKMSMLSSLGRMNLSIRGHSSRSSANYLQGVAATVNVAKRWDASGFLSYRLIDGTLANGGISTILTTGLHRTNREIAKQKVASAFLAGGNLHYTHQGFHLSATALYHSYSLPLIPNRTPLYKRFAPMGNAFWNASISYGYLSHRLALQGETATGSSGVVATIHTVSYLLSEKFSLSALSRFYPSRYFALYGNSFSAGSGVQDESGFYLGARWMPSGRWVIEAYGDVAYFAWPQYQMSAGSYAVDVQGSVMFRPSKTVNLGVRYRYKQKQATSHAMRFFLSTSSERFSGKTQMDVMMRQGSRGYMLSENCGWQWKWLRLNALMGYFHTADYDSRIYCYEPSMLYTMSFANYYGEGIRYALLAKAQLGEHWMMACKMGITDYFDRSHISSGLQEINHSSQSDIEILLKLKW